MKGQYVTHLLIRQFYWNFLLSGREIAYFRSSGIPPQCITTKNQLKSCKYFLNPDKNLGMSQALRRGDEMKFSSGVSQSHRGDELFEIVQ